MTLEEHIQALITQYQKMQQRHKMRADNAYYQFQSEMWQARRLRHHGRGLAAGA